MTTQYSIARAISGQASTSVKLFAVNGDTVLYTADTVVERTNAKGQYLATFGEVAVIPAGNYTQIHFSSGGIPLSIGDRTFLGTDGETATERGAVLDSATQTQLTNIENAAGYTLAVLAGACADPQTSSETYAITVFGSTFTVDMAGQTSTGTRTAPTLTKT